MHLALTDTDALYGAVAFDRACRAAGIQPILGTTVTVQAPLAAKQDAPGRLVLLATGPTGYRSLCRLSSLLQGRPERASLLVQGLSWEALAAHREAMPAVAGGAAGNATKSSGTSSGRSRKPTRTKSLTTRRRAGAKPGAAGAASGGRAGGTRRVKSGRAARKRSRT